jgi:anaerobic magnesium-protoporphyrin IX monomethyl ester cyclase
VASTPSPRVPGARPRGSVQARCDVLFVVPPGGETDRFAEHLGVAYLRAVLEGAGIRARQLLPQRNPSAVGLAAALAESRPAMVGLTVYETNLRACRSAARVIRQTLPEAVVVAGGPNATFSPVETQELLGVDACLRGAGEERVRRVAEAVLGAHQARPRLPELLSAIPGLVIGTPGGTSATEEGDLSSFPGAPFTCLDDLPSPYRLGLVASPAVGIMTARGCNQRCTYCSFAELSGRRLHLHSVDRVLDDLHALAELAARTGYRGLVPVFDDAFTLQPERARRICERIVALGLRLRFNGETRADRVDPELLRLMKAAGFEEVNFGLESAVPRVLRAIGKVQDPATPSDPGLEREREFLERVRSAVAAARAADLRVIVSVIGGLPSETAEDFRATVEFVASLGVGYYAHNALHLFPGTPAYRDRDRLGIPAGRDPETGAWRTRHAFDVGAVPPLPGSSVRSSARAEAWEIADGLCGRPRTWRADDGCAWAVVVHHRRPDARLAAWLSEVLAYHALILVITTRGGSLRQTARAWRRALFSACVPWGSLRFLVLRRASTSAFRLDSAGANESHRFQVEARLEAVRRGVGDDGLGGHDVSIWLPGKAGPPSLPARDAGPLPVVGKGPAPQMADSCRFWSHGRRCTRPLVLHVWRDGAVTPCWRGPRIGRVGDSQETLAARGRALAGTGRVAIRVGSGRCPMTGGGGVRPAIRRAVEAWEVNGQLEWVLRSSGDVEQPSAGNHRAGARDAERNAREPGEGRRERRGDVRGVEPRRGRRQAAGARRLRLRPGAHGTESG